MSNFHAITRRTKVHNHFFKLNDEVCMYAINKVMIANRGEIACRILRTLDRMGIASVMVYHAVDADSPAVRAASETVEIDGPTPVAAYLDMGRIIGACKETDADADAVHPGFGFLAENEAIERARKAIADTLVLGITTNVDYLARIISHPAFAAGRIHTGFIPQYSDDLIAPALTKEQRNLLLAAAALCSREFTNPEFEAIEPYAGIGNWRN